MLVGARVPERTEHHVDERQVTVIKGVYALGVVQGMPLRPLYYIAQPYRCFYITVLEYREEGYSQCSQCGGFGCEACYYHKRKAGHEGKAYHVGNVKVKGAVGIEPLCAVVHLVEDLPEPVVAVQCLVPKVQCKLIGQHGCQSAPIGAQEREVQELEAA